MKKSITLLAFTAALLLGACATSPSNNQTQTFHGTRLIISDECEFDYPMSESGGAVAGLTLASVAADLAVGAVTGAINAAHAATEAKYESNTAFQSNDGLYTVDPASPIPGPEPSGRCLWVVQGKFLGAQRDHDFSFCTKNTNPSPTVDLFQCNETSPAGENLTLVGEPEFALKVAVADAWKGTAFRLVPIGLVFNKQPGKSSIWGSKTSDITVTLKLRTLTEGEETPEFLAHSMTFENLKPGTVLREIALEGHISPAFSRPKLDTAARKAVITAPMKTSAARKTYYDLATAMRGTGVTCLPETGRGSEVSIKACSAPADVTTYTSRTWSVRHDTFAPYVYEASLNCANIAKQPDLQDAYQAMHTCQQLLSDGHWKAYSAEQVGTTKDAQKASIEKALANLKYDMTRQLAQWEARYALGKYVLDNRETINAVPEASKIPFKPTGGHADTNKFLKQTVGKPKKTYLIPYNATAMVTFQKDGSKFLKALKSALSEDTEKSLKEAIQTELHEALDNDVRKAAKNAESAEDIGEQIAMQEALNAVATARSSLQAHIGSEDATPASIATFRNALYAAKLKANKVYAGYGEPLPFPNATAAQTF